MIQASVSLKRVNDYLNSKEINIKAISRDKSDTNAIEMKNASFTWDTEAPPAIENVSFDIPKGSLVAIVGQVMNLFVFLSSYLLFLINITFKFQVLLDFNLNNNTGGLGKIFPVGIFDRRFTKARNG